MSVHHYRRLVIAMSLLALVNAASADPVSIPTRFGAITTNADAQLTHKGKALVPDVTIFSPTAVVQTFRLPSSDVVLVSQAAGTACPGQYVFVSVDATGARVSPTFGTCYDDPVQPTLVGESIAFSMKKMRGKGSARYIYERGVVFEDGKPLK